MFGTDRVEGDTEVLVSDLKPGDVIRFFDGFHDTMEITEVSRLIRQGGSWSYNLCYRDGTTSLFVPGDQVRYLATGAPREHVALN